MYMLLVTPLLAGCAALDDLGNASVNVAVFAVVGTGQLLETATVATVDLAGTTVNAVIRASGTTTREAVDTTADTAILAARRGIEVLEDSNVRQVLQLVSPGGSRFLRITELTTDIGSGLRRVTSVRYEGQDTEGRPIPVPNDACRALDGFPASARDTKQAPHPPP